MASEPDSDSRDRGQEWGSAWKLDYGLSTDVGRVRKINEDAAGAEPDAGLFVVADGMGGHQAGEVASNVAIATMLEHLKQERADHPLARPEMLRDAIKTANTLVMDEAEKAGDRSGMGTTITALQLIGEEFWIGHVGDSRAWRFREDTVDQITRDHSLVSDRVRKGVISPEEAETHPMRNVLTRALGNDPEVEVDVYRGRVRAGDRFVLASDGLTKCVDADRMERFLAENQVARAASDAMVAYAKEHDGTDNITVVVVDCHDPDAHSEENLADTAESQTLAGAAAGTTIVLPELNEADTLEIAARRAPARSAEPPEDETASVPSDEADTVIIDPADRPSLNANHAATAPVDPASPAQPESEDPDSDEPERSS